MDLDIQGASLTIAVGVAAIYFLIYLPYRLLISASPIASVDFGSGFLDFLRGPRDRNKPQSAASNAVLVVMVFGFGMLCENFSDALIRKPPQLVSKSGFSGRLLKLIYFYLPQERELRGMVLFEGETPDKIEPRPLAKEMARNNVFKRAMLPEPKSSEGVESVRIAYDKTVMLEDAIRKFPSDPCSNGLGIEREDCIDLIQNTYYQGINRVTKEDNYHQVLTEIKKRMQFSRSISVISGTSCVLMFLIVLGGSVNFVVGVGRLTPNIEGFSKLDAWFVNQLLGDYHPCIDLNRRVRRFYLKSILVLSFVLGIVFVSRFVFISESVEYNKRVFGFLASELVSSDIFGNELE